MKLQVKFPFTMDQESGPKTFMPRDLIDSKDIDPSLFASLNSKGYFIQLKEKVIETKLTVGAAEVKFENPKDVVIADPLKKEVKPVEVKKEEPKKIETPKVEVKQVEVKKEEPKKIETLKVEVKPVEVKPVEVKPVEVKPVEVKKVESTPIVEEPARRGRASRNS